MPPQGLHPEPQAPDLCVIFALSFAADPSVEGLANPSGGVVGDELVQFSWPRQRVNKVAPEVQVQLEYRAELPSRGPSDLEVTGPYLARTVGFPSLHGSRALVWGLRMSAGQCWG
jgi:hypothetical protein